MATVPRTQIRSGPAAVTITDHLMDPSQMTMSNHPAQSLQYLPLTAVFEQHEVEIRHCVSGGHDAAKTISEIAHRLEGMLVSEISAWKNHLAFQFGVTLREDSPQNPRKRLHPSDDTDNISLAPSRLEGDDTQEGGEYRCLYYEHDPDTYSQCAGKRYGRVSELRRHIKTHTLPHYCTKCGYRTAEERRLNTHKCEEGNHKRYNPVTDEEKEQHEKLGRMGVTVGEMRQILFGSAKSGRKPGSSSDAEDETVTSEFTNRPPLSHTASSSSGTHTPFHFQPIANGINAQPMNQLPPHTQPSSHNSPQINSTVFHTTPPQAQNVFGASPEHFHPFTPHIRSPYHTPHAGLVHSPRRGEAASYYHDGMTDNYSFFGASSPGSGYPPALSEGSTASPPFSNPSAHHTPPPPNSGAYIYSPEGLTNPLMGAQAPLDEYLNTVFPEINNREVDEEKEPIPTDRGRAFTGFGPRPVTPVGVKVGRLKSGMRQKSKTFMGMVSSRRNSSQKSNTFPPTGTRSGPDMGPILTRGGPPDAMDPPPIAGNYLQHPNGVPNTTTTSRAVKYEASGSTQNGVRIKQEDSASSPDDTRDAPDIADKVIPAPSFPEMKRTDTSASLWQRLNPAKTAPPLPTTEQRNGKTDGTSREGPDAVATAEQKKRGWAVTCVRGVERLLRGWRKPQSSASS